VLRNFFAHDGPEFASGLAYTTLLSLVPLMAVVVGVVSAFPVFDRLVAEVQEFAFRNFVPASGELVQEYLTGFAAKTRGLTAVGTGVLIVTSLLMIAAIHAALNRIWGVHRERSFASRFIVYWSVLTLGPLLIGISIAVTSFVMSLPPFSGETLGGFKRQALAFLPWASAAIAFSLLYTVVPDARVRLRDAALSGAVAAFMFELAKHAFAAYLTRFPTYETIYGALAAVPAFLVWIYVSWVMILLGAELCCRLGYPQRLDGPIRPTAEQFRLAFRLLGHLHCGRAVEATRSTIELEDAESDSGAEAVGSTLRGLAEAGMVLRTEEGRWALALDPRDLTLHALLTARPFVLPSSTELASGDAWDRALAQALHSAESELAERLGTPLSVLYTPEVVSASNASSGTSA
jgi:membrane protein